MSKVLVLPGTNFYNNKLDTIEFADVPCTSIALDKESASISTTTTITATVLPANTTDEVTWLTSNPAVATVNNGIVTAVSNGSAVITAKCGSHSATCEITVSLPMFVTKQGLLRVNPGSSDLKTDAACTTGDRYITVGATTGTYHALGHDGTGRSELLQVYPYKIPSGATKINVDCPSGLAPIIVFYDANNKSTTQGLDQECAKVLDGQTPLPGSDWSIAGWEYGDKIFDVSNVTGVNSFTLSFYTKTASDYNNFDVNNPGITITFE